MIVLALIVLRIVKNRCAVARATVNPPACGTESSAPQPGMKIGL